MNIANFTIFSVIFGLCSLVGYCKVLEKNEFNEFDFNLFSHPVFIDNKVHTYSISNEFVTDGGKWNGLGLSFSLSKISKNGSVILNKKYKGDWVASYFIINTKSINYDYGYLIIGYTDNEKRFYNVSVNFKGDFFPIGMSYDVFGGLQNFHVNDKFKRELVEFDQVAFIRKSLKRGHVILSPWNPDEPLPVNPNHLEKMIIHRLSGPNNETWKIKNVNIVSHDDIAGWILVFNCVSDKGNVTRVYSDFGGRKIVKEINYERQK